MITLTEFGQYGVLYGVWSSRKSEEKSLLLFRASPEGRIGVSIYTGEGCHLGGIIGIPWAGSETGFGVHVAVMLPYEQGCESAGKTIACSERNV